ncbi:MAG: carboxypeptidase M32 [Pseudomonadota bacterium]
MTAYDDMMAHVRQTTALGLVSWRLSWDQETVMPRGAAPQRAEELAALEGVLHEKRTNPAVGDWLEAVDTGALDAAQQAQVREVRRSFERASKVPAALVAEIARVTSLSQGIWTEARADEDYDAFLPTLQQVIGLRQQEAAALAGGGDPYDALLDDYEPAATGAEIDKIFGAMRPRLVALREKILGAPAPQALTGTFDEAEQMAVSRELAAAFGYDFDRGRIDKAVHPFSSGSGLDVRITTRTALDNPFNCFYSTIHEVGHASYEQNIDRDFLLTPLGRGVSMGVHESQSRIYENQLGRGRAFTGWLFSKMTDRFGDLGLKDAEAFFAAVNRVDPGLIRTEADEVHYNLHIMMRYDLERALISGDLSAADLPAAWNDRFLADFGVAVDRPSNGCLQDVHWSVGLFGYFPTYSLGNVYAGCLYKALCAAVPDHADALAEGDARPATAWLAEVLQRHGGRRDPRSTIQHACGFVPTEGPLLDYLEAKFGTIYAL